MVPYVENSWLAQPERPNTYRLPLLKYAGIIAFGMAIFGAPSIEARAQETVSLQAADGWVLAADVYGSGPRGLVLIHGGQLTKESWRKQAEQFRAAGYHVIAMDLRGFGQSQSAPIRSASEERKELDVVAAVEYLRAHGAAKVSLIGGSMGGDAAADASRLISGGTIECVVLLSSAGGNRPEQIVARKLLVIAERDDTRSNGDRRWPAIREGYERATVRKSLLLLEGTAHAQAMFGTIEGDKITKAILSFLAEPCVQP